MSPSQSIRLSYTYNILYYIWRYAPRRVGTRGGIDNAVVISHYWSLRFSRRHQFSEYWTVRFLHHLFSHSASMNEYTGRTRFPLPQYNRSLSDAPALGVSNGLKLREASQKLPMRWGICELELKPNRTSYIDQLRGEFPLGIPRLAISRLYVEGSLVRRFKVMCDVTMQSIPTMATYLRPQPQ